MKRVVCWIVLGIGIGIGVGLSVAVAYRYGPRGAETMADLYTDASWTYHHWLWHRWRTDDPEAEYTKWAREHKGSSRLYWPTYACSQERYWFGPTEAGDAFRTFGIRLIYELPLPEEERIALLHEYHEDLDHATQERPLEALYSKWGKKVAQINAEIDAERASPEMAVR